MKICITGFQPDDTNRQQYAKFHGYDYREIKNKQEFELLCNTDNWDWVHWLSPGCMFMNFSYNLNHLIDEYPGATYLCTRKNEQIMRKTKIHQHSKIYIPKRSVLSYEHGDFVIHSKNISKIWCIPFFDYYFHKWKVCSDILSFVLFIAFSWSVNLIVLFVVIIIFDLMLRFLPIICTK